MRKEWGNKRALEKIIIGSMDNYYWSRCQNIVDQKLMNFKYIRTLGKEKNKYDTKKNQ